MFQIVGAQDITSIKGKVYNVVTQEPILGAVVTFSGDKKGVSTDYAGSFFISNSLDLDRVNINILGYEPMSFLIPKGEHTNQNVYLLPKELELNEVQITSEKEKYDKNNNPAILLIQKVIQNKKSNSIYSQKNYKFDEYQYFMLGIDDLDDISEKPNKYEKFREYADSSKIDKKLILPITLKEKISDIVVGENQNKLKHTIKAQQIIGIDENMEQEAIEQYIENTLPKININDNYITLLNKNFVSPLSSTQATSFYKWYLGDTILIDNERIVDLSFIPFNSMELGFRGKMAINIDNNFALQNIELVTPKNIDLNWIKDLYFTIDLKKADFDDVWYPNQTILAINISLMDIAKLYVEKSWTINHVERLKENKNNFTDQNDLEYLENYNSRDEYYWENARPENFNMHLKMENMMKELRNTRVLKIFTIFGDIAQMGFLPLTKNPKTNKFEIGDLRSLYSFNHVEGSRFRLGIATTSNFNKHLYFYLYGAYGTKDRTFKYFAQSAWSFKDTKKHKDEYPKNVLSLSMQYDMQALGQSFNQAERDNILMSFTSAKSDRLIYNKNIVMKYEREYYNGFSYKLSFGNYILSPAGRTKFEKKNDLNEIISIKDFKNTLASIELKYAVKERFTQQRSKRFILPSEKFIVSFIYERGMKGVFSSEFNYDKIHLEFQKYIWFTPYGELDFRGSYQQVFGKTPFPLLITPDANTSFTSQNFGFYLIKPLEFIHDRQVSGEINYHLGGYIFNKLPLIKKMKLREVAGFRGFYGGLRQENSPYGNSQNTMFPNNTIRTMEHIPYMEYNIGIENIFKFFRVDYIRRLNYKDYEGVKNSGFRFMVQFQF